MSSRRPSRENMHGSGGAAGTSTGDKEKSEDVQDGRISVYVHKREDQSSHEVIQPLLRSEIQH